MFFLASGTQADRVPLDPHVGAASHRARRLEEGGEVDDLVNVVGSSDALTGQGSDHRRYPWAFGHDGVDRRGNSADGGWLADAPAACNREQEQRNEEPPHRCSLSAVGFSYRLPGTRPWSLAASRGGSKGDPHVRQSE
jgi:hypothetical protein